MSNSNTDHIFMEELKKEFMESTAVNLKEMTALIKENKFERIAYIAHDIKGTAGVFKFDEGTDIAEQLELAAKDEDLEETKELIDRLREYMKKNGLDI